MKKQTKLLLVLYGLVAILAICVGIYAYLSGQLSGEAQYVTGPQSRVTRLMLSPTSGVYRVGSTFQVDIGLDTGGHHTSGADAVITYNPKQLAVVDSDKTKSGVQVAPGSLYPKYPFNSVSSGTISVSGVIQPGSAGYSGIGTFATITFKVLRATSSSQVQFDFTPGSTADSNVASISGGADLLEQVRNASFVLSMYQR